jgi:hypothetical protein
MEKSLFLVLSFIVGLCVIGTLISIGGVLYLRYRSDVSPATRHSHKIISIVQTPAAAALHLKSDRNQTLHKPIVTVTTTAAPDASTSRQEEITIRDIEERLIPELISEATPITQSSANMSRSTTKRPETSTSPTFVTIRNQWSLEQPPSARQLLQAVKQFFHYFRTGRYEVEKTL